jgi:gas vesicle protein
MLDKKVFAALDQKFGSEPTTPPSLVSQAPAAVIPVSEEQVEDDFDQARQALKNMLRKGQDVVEDMASIAKQSDHPRAFEVTGQLIKTVAETAKDLMALQKQKKELSAPAAGDIPKQIGTQNNIVFSGSTADLIKMLKNKNENVIDAENHSQ